MFADHSTPSFGRGFERGFVWGVLLTALGWVMWRGRYFLMAFIAGWFSQYYLMGDADVDRLIEAKFDETKVEMVSLNLSSRSTQLDNSNDGFNALGFVTVANNTPATLTKFSLRCTYYRKSYRGNPIDELRTSWYSIYEPQRLQPGSTGVFKVFASGSVSGDFNEIDRSTLNCALKNPYFDRREQVESIKRARAKS